YVSNRIFLRAFMHRTSYELRFGRQPRVDHLRVFGCRCFVLKDGNLDKFESRSSDGVFLGYASHSRAYRVLIIDTNIVRETCEVTFDETAPCNSSVFEVAGDDELGTPIFEDEEEEAAEGDDDATPRAVDPAASATSSDDDGGPDPTTSTSRGPIEHVGTLHQGYPLLLQQGRTRVVIRNYSKRGGAAGPHRSGSYLTGPTAPDLLSALGQVR